jgi:hypothetical protein
MEKGMEALKTLPKEIVDFVKPPKKIEVTLTWPKELTPEKPTDPLKDESIIQTVIKPKKNDNPKQKVGTAGKRQPKRVGKAK